MSFWDTIGGRIVKAAAGVTGVTEVTSIASDLGHAKNIGDAFSRLPGAIVAAPLSQVTAVASAIAPKNVVSKDLGAIHTAAVHDPGDSLAVLGGAVAVVGGVFTGGAVSVAGIASIAKGAAGILDKSGLLQGKPISEQNGNVVTPGSSSSTGSTPSSSSKAAAAAPKKPGAVTSGTEKAKAKAKASLWARIKVELSRFADAFHLHRAAKGKA